MQTPSSTGDIILFTRAQKRMNIIVQSALRITRAKHHHVAIALYNHSLIHAMPKSGIHLRPLVEYLNENKEFVVFRHKNSFDEQNSEHLEKYLRHHNLQRYSLLNTIYSSPRHSFCSELAAKAYEKSEMKLTKGHKKPKSVLPFDIYNYVSSSPDWIDITQYYKDFYFDNSEKSSLILGSEVEQRLVDLAQEMGFNQQLLVNRINSTNTTNRATPLTAPMSFWTNHLAGPGTIAHLLWYWKGMLISLIRHTAKQVKKKLSPKDKPSAKETQKSEDTES
ncbi:YiiX/YebB-like N1pC/P60 family cysteine hydrolase [Pseudomonas zeae]|uniref:YiiX/YebB-like N1pC/P60 family cysteine hydrolase n=1 Tax=Pseudomonas zeae TaxID=2745510 RepID=UPI002148DC97|nr:YiiX/YebB-like N1pC/P60 family cysteine hydrolase [Pseudomonas zeae]UUT14507.1 YiiX/YebB-like N1pC/P60 family cysteine hydrolase [Pseudomonas zeae]